jgi:hypothetical protein
MMESIKPIKDRDNKIILLNHEYDKNWLSNVLIFNLNYKNPKKNDLPPKRGNDLNRVSGDKKDYTYLIYGQ